VSGDIVERLRPALVRYCRTSEECMGSCKNACAWHKELLTYENVAAAADEIERLRFEFDVYKKGYKGERALAAELAEALAWELDCTQDAATTRTMKRNALAAWREARRER